MALKIQGCKATQNYHSRHCRMEYNKEETNMSKFMDKLKKAPKKNLAMGFLCFAGIIALIVWMITWFI